MTKVSAGLVTLVAAAVLVAPAFADPPDDSYPVSNYPMFAHPIDAIEEVSVVVGVTDDGEELRLRPGLIAGSDEVIHAVGIAGRYIAEGRADELCADVAGRIATDGDPAIATVEVRRDRIDALLFFSDRAESVLDRDVRASCEVVR